LAFICYGGVSFNGKISGTLSDVLIFLIILDDKYTYCDSHHNMATLTGLNSPKRSVKRLERNYIKGITTWIK
jgi:hypothetical protein